MRFNNRDDIIALTPQWKGERFPDGRPKVPDKYLDELRKMTLEELWKPIFVQGYENQFLAMKSLHPEFKENGELNCKLIGRAVTAAYGPTRPDYYEATMAQAAAEGRTGTPNQWVIECLTDRDVCVVDMYDKIYKGTFVGGNLTTAIKNKTHTGGAVIWGGIRDMEQIVKIDGINVYYRGIDPTGIGDVTMTGFNVPCRIGKATCLPGDVVLGTISGVIFIPAHLAEEVVIGAEKSHVRDIFGFQRLHDKVYTTAQIDARWTYPMWQDFINWFNTDPKAEEYRHLTWEEELAEAEKYEKDANASDVRL